MGEGAGVAREGKGKPTDNSSPQGCTRELQSISFSVGGGAGGGGGVDRGGSGGDEAAAMVSGEIGMGAEGAAGGVLVSADASIAAAGAIGAGGVGRGHRATTTAPGAAATPAANSKEDEAEQKEEEEEESTAGVLLNRPGVSGAGVGAGAARTAGNDVVCLGDEPDRGGLEGAGTDGEGMKERVRPASTLLEAVNALQPQPQPQPQPHAPSAAVNPLPILPDGPHLAAGGGSTGGGGDGGPDRGKAAGGVDFPAQPHAGSTILKQMVDRVRATSSGCTASVHREGRVRKGGADRYSCAASTADGGSSALLFSSSSSLSSSFSSSLNSSCTILAAAAATAAATGAQPVSSGTQDASRRLSSRDCGSKGVSAVVAQELIGKGE